MATNFRNTNVRPPGQGGQYYPDNRRGHGRARNPNQYYAGRNPREWRRGGPGGGGDGPRRVDTDGDVMMGDDNREASNRRFNPYNISIRNQRRPHRGGGSFYRGGRPSGQDDSIMGSHSRGDSWSKVMLPMAKRLNKDAVARTLIEDCPVPLMMYNLHNSGNAIMFFVRDMSAAIALKKMSGVVKMPDGFKLKIVVHGTDTPHMYINDEATKSLRTCVQRRYVPQTQALDLSSLHHDAGMNNEGFVLYLKYHNVANVVSLAINEIVPEIHCLNLSGNELANLDILNRTNEKLANLRVLILDSNKLTRLNDLNSINGFPLEELSLRDNLLVRPRQNTRTRYVEDLRRRFPKLVKLDGQELPPQIGFDVEKPVTLPPTRDSFFVSDYGRQIALQFFEQYFTLYDTNRPDVADAYHLNSVFSLVTVKSDHIRGATLSNYLQHSRNMLRVMDQERREKLLSQGVSNIMATLNRLPKTSHYPETISMDVIVSTSEFTSVSISGVFREFETSVTKADLYRAFNRSFILVPIGGGFKIVNDMLLITVPTPEQKNLALKNMVNVETPTANPLPSTSAVVPDEMMKQQMVAAFSNESKMNTEWSIRCLVEFNWDFNKAAQAFTDLNAKGGIPPEAFIKLEPI